MALGESKLVLRCLWNKLEFYIDYATYLNCVSFFKSESIYRKDSWEKCLNWKYSVSDLASCPVPSLESLLILSWPWWWWHNNSVVRKCGDKDGWWCTQVHKLLLWTHQHLQCHHGQKWWKWSLLIRSQVDNTSKCCPSLNLKTLFFSFFRRYTIVLEIVVERIHLFLFTEQ